MRDRGAQDAFAAARSASPLATDVSSPPFRSRELLGLDGVVQAELGTSP